MMSDDPESELVRELRSLAEVDSDRSDFFLRHGAHSIRVSYTSGSSSSLELSIGYNAVARRDHPALVTRASHGYREHDGGPLAAPRPLDIELRREDSVDRAAKSHGLSVEWQSGDAVFDDAVYVATSTNDSEVLAAVLGPQVRKGVLELVELGFRKIAIDDASGEVRAHLSEFTRATPSPKRGARTIRAFAQIVSNLPYIASSGEAHEPVPLAGFTMFLRVIGLLGWATNVGYVAAVIALTAKLHPQSKEVEISTLTFVWVVVAAITCGVLGAKFYGSFVGERVRGSSRAHERVASAGWSAFGGFSVIALTLLLVVVVLGGR